MFIDTIVSNVSDEPGRCEYRSKVPEPLDDFEVFDPLEVFDMLVRTDVDVADE